jgi:hypothetical protein
VKRTNPASSEDFGSLRNSFDGSDSFMRGHQITTLGNRKRDRCIPEWTKYDAQIQGVLSRSFPKLGTNKKQRAQAGCWSQFIYLYWRASEDRQTIMSEMRLTAEQFKTLRTRIVRAGNGLPTDGRKKRGGPRGGDWKKREGERGTPIMYMWSGPDDEPVLQPGEHLVPHSEALNKINRRESK